MVVAVAVAHEHDDVKLGIGCLGTRGVGKGAPVGGVQGVGRNIVVCLAPAADAGDNKHVFFFICNSSSAHKSALSTMPLPHPAHHISGRAEVLRSERVTACAISSLLYGRLRVRLPDAVWLAAAIPLAVRRMAAQRLGMFMVAGLIACYRAATICAGVMMLPL